MLQDEGNQRPWCQPRDGLADDRRDREEIAHRCVAHGNDARAAVFADIDTAFSGKLAQHALLGLCHCGCLAQTCVEACFHGTVEALIQHGLQRGGNDPAIVDHVLYDHRCSICP